MSTLLTRLGHRARAIKCDTHALYLAARAPRVPWYAELTAACVAAYALSAIDLIPDFVPVLGHLDDVVIVPLGIMLALWMIPAAIMAEHRATAQLAQQRPMSTAGAVAIAAVWVAAIALTAWLAWRYLYSLTRPRSGLLVRAAPVC